MFKLLEAFFELMIPLFMANIIDRGIAHRDMGYIGKMGLCLIGLGVIGLVSAITAQFFSVRQGQKQLLCIARVMLCLPPMMILDEGWQYYRTGRP